MKLRRVQHSNDAIDVETRQIQRQIRGNIQKRIDRQTFTFTSVAWATVAAHKVSSHSP